MAEQINSSNEQDISSSDEEREKTARRWIDNKTYYKKNAINEDDWSSSDDDELSHHHKEPENFKDLDWIDVPSCIHNMDGISKNQFDRRMACYYKKRLLSIRRKLATDNLVLRPVYKGIGYHLSSANDFHQKVSTFMTRPGIYSVVQKLNPDYSTGSQECLADIVNRVETTLDNLFHSKCITEKQYMTMSINRTLVRLNYLYFLSETHQEGIPVQPIIVCNDGPTMNISRYLGRLLGLVFNDATYCTTFSKSVDVIHTLGFYSQCGHLQPTTLFASFNINDLCTTFSHQQAINALEHFLNYYASDHLIGGMNIDTILQLVRLILNNQYFVYNNKLYRQTAGSASGSPLTIPLVYIYLFYWQQNLLNDFVNKNEIFGRYQDEAFITWNRSENQLRTLLAMANSQFPQFMWNTTSIGSTIHFRDIELGHNNGILHTSVYHEPIFGDDILPSFLDVIQHPVQDIWKWLRAALLKAVRYCSDDDSFDNEKHEIRSILDRNGFSDAFFDQGLDEFLDQFGVFVTYPPFIRSNYEILRGHVFNYDKHRAAKKKERQLQQQQQQQHIALHLPHTPNWDRSAMADFEQKLNNLLNEHFGDHPKMKNFWIKILQHHPFPVPIDDLLVKKRPSLRLLTLPVNEKHKQSTY